MLVPLRLNLYPQYAGGYAGEFVDYGTLGERARKQVSPEEEKVEEIVSRLAESVVEKKIQSAEKDLELMLRLKLEQEGIMFKLAYLELLICQVDMRKRNAAIFLLLLN